MEIWIVYIGWFVQQTQTREKDRIGGFFLFHVIRFASQRRFVHFQIVALNKDSIGRQQIAVLDLYGKEMCDDCWWFMQKIDWLGKCRQRRFRRRISGCFRLRATRRTCARPRCGSAVRGIVSPWCNRWRQSQRRRLWRRSEWRGPRSTRAIYPPHDLLQIREWKQDNKIHWDLPKKLSHQTQRADIKINEPILLEGMKERSSETIAAICRMMRVTSWSASHTSRQKDLDGFGGIVLEPNTWRRCSISLAAPDNPVQIQMLNLQKLNKWNWRPIKYLR